MMRKKKMNRLHMAGEYIMSTRQNALHEWLTTTQGMNAYTLTPLAGDASFRRYFRLTTLKSRYVVMDAPPEKEGLTTFIQIGRALAEHGIHTPAISAIDLEQGFLLLEDLGDMLLGHQLTSHNANARYIAALDTLLKMQTCPTPQSSYPIFDTAFMQQEMNLFQTWFLEGLLNINLTASEQKQLNNVFSLLTHHLEEQPTCFIHRDYHSRNLLIVNEETLDIGVIDFQDAMRGPFTYDLVSLLKDCYVQWPDKERHQWMTYFYQNLPHQAGWSLSEFQHGFDWCGLQRHFKVLGIFARLHLRDNKSTYLKDLPLTLHYALTCLAQYPAFHSFYDMMQERVVPIFEEKQTA
jgi:aminoglycoside/choline kinase family phosphotransferase